MKRILLMDSLPYYPHFCSLICDKKKYKDKDLISYYCFKSYIEEKTAIKMSLRAHMKYFKKKYRKDVINYCKKFCNRDFCLLRQRIKNSKIFVHKTSLCKIYYCPEHRVWRNFCYNCKRDMGEYAFTRQLCEKYYCGSDPLSNLG